MAIGRRLGVWVALALVAASSGGPAAAGTGPALAFGRTTAAGDETSPEEARLIEEIASSAARRQELDGRLADLDEQIRVVRGELRVAESRLSALFARQRGAEVRLDEARHQLELSRRALRHQALAVYTGEGDAGRIAGMLARVQDVGALATKRSYLRIVASTQAEVVSAHEALQDRTQDLVSELSAARAKAQAERDVVERQRSRLQDERDAQDAIRHQVDREIARREGLLADARARRAELEAPALALQQQSAALEGSLRGRQDAQTSASASGGRLATPIPGAPVASGFGPRVHPIYGNVRVHTGVDLSAGTGVPIRAAADGVVMTAGWLGGYGNAAVVEHGGPLATLYAHQSQILVSVGQRVERGQVIGRVGCTGTCTGPHLHYEVRIDGTPVNPVPYL